MLKRCFFLLVLMMAFTCRGQESYTSYFTGDVADVEVPVSPGYVLMGGAGEHDEAMRWFLQKAEGGDVVVIRASGSDGYNNYLYSGLGVNVNSVETIVFNDASATTQLYVIQQLQNAEAIWIAGGDQWDYVSYWKDNDIEYAINNLINVKGGPVGGISAGMAVMGGAYFNAQNGTVSSGAALANPYNSDVQIGHSDFIETPFLEDVITDTHYNDPDRRGRHSVFMARMKTDFGFTTPRGIACDEYTAVCIDENGIAHCYGEAPDYQEYVYFISSNCEENHPEPESCAPGQALTWDANASALKVYRVLADESGTQTFNLNDWESGSGGEWFNWSVVDGELFQESASEPDCLGTGLDEEIIKEIEIFPNPAQEYFHLDASNFDCRELKISNMLGEVVMKAQLSSSTKTTINIEQLQHGIYLVNACGRQQKLIVE